VHLALADGQVDALEDLGALAGGGVLGGDVEPLDGEQRRGHRFRA
jgi:hypothetical protein